MLPESWIDRIFSRMEGRYGSLLLDRWKGCDIGNVKATWREELSGFADKPECIAYALKSLGDKKFPPTLPEFIAACRRAPKKEAPMLSYTPTPEDEAKARAAIAKAASDLKPKYEGGIDRHWATHPRSEMQLRFIFDAARNDAMFRPCVSEMVEQGICTEDGKLLRKYSSGGWTKA